MYDILAGDEVFSVPESVAERLAFVLDITLDVSEMAENGRHRILIVVVLGALAQVGYAAL